MRRVYNREDDGEDDGDRERKREKVRNLSNPPVPSILATPENHCMRPALKRTLGQRGLQQ